MSGTQVQLEPRSPLRKRRKERSSSSPTLQEGNPSRSLTTSAQPGKPAFLLMSSGGGEVGVDRAELPDI
jgi:hypothetical protein